MATRRSPDHFSGKNVKVGIIGLGYVGLPLALRFAEQGHQVKGFDTDPDKVSRLNAGQTYIQHIPADKIAQFHRSGAFSATTDFAEIAGRDAVIICVPTPLDERYQPDLSYVEQTARSIQPHLQREQLVVLESTTYPGTTEELLRPILESGGLRAETDFFIGYSPERIDPGNATWSFVNTPKVVSGIGPSSRAAVEDFYSSLVDKIVPVASPGEAELVKLLENTFRHVNIALVNELAMFARDLGVDIWAAVDAAATKPYGFMRFTPGPGAGGHCLPVDPSYLAWRVERQLGHRFRFVELANEVNRGMPEYVVSRVISLLNGERRAVNGSRILVIGLAYKAGTSDWRESPAMTIAEQLLSLGADVRAHDAHVPANARLGPPIPRVACSVEEIAAADLVVLCVDHPELPYDDIAEHARLVLDTRGRLRDFSIRGETL